MHGVSSVQQKSYLYKKRKRNKAIWTVFRQCVSAIHTSFEDAHRQRRVQHGCCCSADKHER